MGILRKAIGFSALSLAGFATYRHFKPAAAAAKPATVVAPGTTTKPVAPVPGVPAQNTTPAPTPGANVNQQTTGDTNYAPSGGADIATNGVPDSASGNDANAILSDASGNDANAILSDVATAATMLG